MHVCSMYVLVYECMYMHMYVCVCFNCSLNYYLSEHKIITNKVKVRGRG